MSSSQWQQAKDKARTDGARLPCCRSRSDLMGLGDCGWHYLLSAKMKRIPRGYPERARVTAAASSSSRFLCAPSLAAAIERSWEVPGAGCEDRAPWECPCSHVRVTAQVFSAHSRYPCSGVPANVNKCLSSFIPASSPLNTIKTFYALDE